MKKIVLAFSGGLDTSFCVPYLKEQGFEDRQLNKQVKDIVSTQITTASGEITTVDLSRYATGVYFLKLVNDGKVVAVKKAVRR